MKTFLLLVGSLAACLISGAQVIEYAYSATFYDLWTYDQASGAITHSNNGSLIGYAVKVGDAFRGSFKYDVDAKPTGEIDPDFGMQVFLSAGKGFGIQYPTAGMSFSTTDVGSVVIADSSRSWTHWDDFSFIGPIPIDSRFGFGQGQISLFDFDGTILRGYDLPSQLFLSDFEYANFDLELLDRGTGNQLHASARITALQPVASAVPEPSTFGIGSVFALVAIVVWRLRTQK